MVTVGFSGSSASLTSGELVHVCWVAVTLKDDCEEPQGTGDGLTWREVQTLPLCAHSGALRLEWDDGGAHIIIGHRALLLETSASNIPLSLIPQAL